MASRLLTKVEQYAAGLSSTAKMLNRSFKNTAPDVSVREFKDDEVTYRGFTCKKKDITYDDVSEKTEKKITRSDIEAHFNDLRRIGHSTSDSKRIAIEFAGPAGSVDTIALKDRRAIDVSKTIGKSQEKEFLLDGITRAEVIETFDVATEEVFINRSFKKK